MPIIKSTRLVGLEVELDAARTRLSLPAAIPSGWSQKHDASLQNGVEMVLEPPVQARNLLPLTNAFEKAYLVEAKTNTGKRGGFHVHVQVADYTLDDCYSLAKLYSHFQPAINSLVAESRRDNNYCPAFPDRLSRENLIAMFRLNEPAQNRAYAKHSRVFSVINFAMVRCSNPDDRTVEFRQGSTSCRSVNLYGWTALVTALTIFARRFDRGAQFQTKRSDIRGLVEFLEEHETTGEYAGAQPSFEKLVNWVKWRYNYMNAKPTPKQIEKAVALVRKTPHGIFHVSRELNVSLGTAKKIMEEGVRKQMLVRVNAAQYRVTEGSSSEQELEELLAAHEAVDRTR